MVDRRAKNSSSRVVRIMVMCAPVWRDETDCRPGSSAALAVAGRQYGQFDQPLMPLVQGGASEGPW